jgi:hypothetical protein
MINTEDKSRYDNDKLLKSRRSAETFPKTHKEITDIVNHDPPSLLPSPIVSGNILCR